MPPSPKMEAKISEDHLARACVELKIARPEIKITKSPTHGLFYGHYVWPHHRIHLYLDLNVQQVEQLRFVNTQACTTLLHELRHGWQAYHNHTLFRDEFACETDADGWAARRLSDYLGLVRVTRSYPNSPFSRLSRHDRRQNV